MKSKVLIICILITCFSCQKKNNQKESSEDLDNRIRIEIVKNMLLDNWGKSTIDSITFECNEIQDKEAYKILSDHYKKDGLIMSQLLGVEVAEYSWSKAKKYEERSKELTGKVSYYKIDYIISPHSYFMILNDKNKRIEEDDTYPVNLKNEK